MSLLKAIASWRILAPALISIMVTWLMISCVLFLSSVRATGKVVQLVQNGSGDDVYYCPVTVFKDATGMEHTIRSSGGSNPPRFPMGSTVSVLYRSNNPDAGMIEDRFMLWICPLLLMALAIFYGSIGLVVDRWLQKQETQKVV